MMGEGGQTEPPEKLPSKGPALLGLRYSENIIWRLTLCIVSCFQGKLCVFFLKILQL